MRLYFNTQKFYFLSFIFVNMSEESIDPTESFINDFMTKLELKGKPTFNKIKDFTEKVGLDFDKVNT